MEARYDIRVEKDYINANNDVEWFQSDIRHQRDSIELKPGECKEFPSDGVNISKYMSSSGQEDTISRSIILELTSDGYYCKQPKVSFDTNGKLIIDPNATL